MTSCLLYHEQGRIRPEDFTDCDKPIHLTFTIPKLAVERAEIFLVARKGVPDPGELIISIAGQNYSFNNNFSPCTPRWLRGLIDPAHLCVGDNRVTVQVNPQWQIPFEASTRFPVLRLRLEGNFASENLSLLDGVGMAQFGDFSREVPQYGDPVIERDREKWIKLLPQELQTMENPWTWCWELAGYLSQAWKYANITDAASYAPWDARVILEWGRKGCDGEGKKPIVMCVHYAVSFIQFCIAMGVRARAVVLTPGINLYEGHFVAEVWLEKYQSWAMIDPHMHLCFKDPITARPLATSELASHKHLDQAVVIGRGFECHRARFQKIVELNFLTGSQYRHWGVWSRHDWIANPDLAPPAHGCSVFTETDILWQVDREEGVSSLAMFPKLSMSLPKGTEIKRAHLQVL